MITSRVEVRSILTRTSGYLATVCSHSAQPYRGCPFGSALCGVGCYVRHNIHVTQGREWGSFLDVRANAADVYRVTHDGERRWARRERSRFSIFLSSATEPFPPAESRHGVTSALLDAMIAAPPDELIVQTHSHRVVDQHARLRALHAVTRLRVHVSIETDRERIAGLPPHGSSVASRLEASGRLHDEGIRTIITVSPLLPIAEPEAFFARIAEVADGVVLDHYIGGDGSADGARTKRTRLPTVMEAIEPGSASLEYREAMGRVARRIMPGRVGFHIDGFADRNWS